MRSGNWVTNRFDRLPSTRIGPLYVFERSGISVCYCVIGTTRLPSAIKRRGNVATAVKDPSLESIRYKGYDIRFRSKPCFDRLYVELSNACNFSCEMCFISEEDRRRGEMIAPQTMERMAEEMSRYPERPEIVFAGIGEPLLHDDWRTFLLRFKEIPLKVSLHTNGALLSEEAMAFLVDAQMDHLCLSLDPEGFGHESGEATLEKVERLDAIKKLKGSVRPSISIQSVLCSKNIAGVEAFGKRIAHMDVSEWILSNLLPMNAAQAGMALYPTRPVEGSIPLGESFSSRFPFARLPSFRLIGERGCSFIDKNSLVVGADGRVTHCYPFLRSHETYPFGKKHPVAAYAFGHYPNESLLSIWQKPEVSGFRVKARLGLFPYCFECKWLDTCELITRGSTDCYGNVPSCADCLWYHRLIMCF